MMSGNTLNFSIVARDRLRITSNFGDASKSTFTYQLVELPVSICIAGQSGMRNRWTWYAATSRMETTFNPNRNITLDTPGIMYAFDASLRRLCSGL